MKYITVSAEKTLRYERKLEIGVDISEEDARLLLESNNDTVNQHNHPDEFEVLETVLPDGLGYSDEFDSVYASKSE